MIFSIIAAGDVSGFDKISYRSNLEAMLSVRARVVPSDVQITASAASVLVVATVSFEQTSDASTAIDTILSMSINGLRLYLGDQVEQIRTVRLATASGVAIGQPGQGGPTAAQRVDNDDSDRTAWVVGLVVALVLLSVLLGALLWMARKMQKPPQDAVARAIHVHDVSLMSSSTTASSGGAAPVTPTRAPVSSGPSAAAEPNEVTGRVVSDDDSPPVQARQLEWLANQALTPGEPMPTTPGHA